MCGQIRSGTVEEEEEEEEEEGEDEEYIDQQHQRGRERLLGKLNLVANYVKINSRKQTDKETDSKKDIQKPMTERERNTADVTI